jgi:hypothetical protein
MRNLFLISILSVSAFAGIGCHPKPAEGPAERAGKSVDNAADKTKDAAKDAADSTKDAAGDAKKKIENK